MRPSNQAERNRTATVAMSMRKDLSCCCPYTNRLKVYHCLWWNTIRTNDATCAQKNTNEAKFSLLYWPIETELLLHRKHRRKAWCLLNYMHRRAYAPTSIELIAQNMTYIVIWSYIPCISSNTTSNGLNPITATWIFFCNYLKLRSRHLYMPPTSSRTL